MQLVSDGRASDDAVAPRRRPDEAAERFGGSGYRAPSFVDEEPEVDRLRRLGRLVAVGATDVRIHLERVNTCVELGDRDGAFGALLDLFIATGTSAREVKRRCMFWAGDVLDPHQRLFLDENLESGIGRSTPTPHAPRSVLASGITGSVRLVEVRARVEDRSPAELPPSVTDAVEGAWDDSGPAPLPRRGGGARTAAPQRPAGPETHSTIGDIPRFDASRTLIEVVRKTAATLPESSPGVEVEGRFGRIVVDRVHLRMDIARPDLLQLDISELDLQLRTADGADSGDGSMPYGVGLWRLVLAVSAGRLPQDLDPDGPHRLRRWPDLARVDRIDGDTKMSALLQRAPMTLTALSDEIGSAATVASFATATWLTGLLEPSGPVTGAARGPRSAAEPAGVVDAAAGPGGAERWGALRSLARRFRKGTS